MSAVAYIVIAYLTGLHDTLALATVVMLMNFCPVAEMLAKKRHPVKPLAERAVRLLFHSKSCCSLCAMKYMGENDQIKYFKNAKNV